MKFSHVEKLSTLQNVHLFNRVVWKLCKLLLIDEESYESCFLALDLLDLVTLVRVSCIFRFKLHVIRNFSDFQPFRDS